MHSIANKGFHNQRPNENKRKHKMPPITNQTSSIKTTTHQHSANNQKNNDQNRIPKPENATLEENPNQQKMQGFLILRNHRRIHETVSEHQRT